MMLSELPRPHGVSVSRASIYAPKEKFLCENGEKSINYDKINDDYCDCSDGSDEPGTSACPNGIFHCMNLGYKPENIPSSRVNDGICDCCDASDEYNSTNDCVNNCMELGLEKRQREKDYSELVKKGNIYRLELAKKGKLSKESREKKLEELKIRKAESEAIREEIQLRKKEVEAAENEALEVYREMQEAEDRAKKEEEANNNRKEAENIFAKFDSNSDGFIEITEIQTRITFDKDRDGVVTTEEAKYFLDERDQVDQETFINLAWPRIKPYLMLESGLFKPQIKDTEVDVEEESKNENVQEESYLHEEEQEGSTKEAEQGYEDEEGNLEESESAETTTPIKEYDPETQKLIEIANTVRNEYLEADKTVREINNEIEEIENLISKDYGFDEEYSILDGECFTYEDREYVYKLCMFDRASQQPRAGGAETKLGSWGRWDGESENKYSRMLYTNGASCWNGPLRSAIIKIECGLENKIKSVTEPNRCEYHFLFQTPAACYSIDELQKYDYHDEL